MITASANDTAPGFALAELSGRMVGADSAYCDLLRLDLGEVCRRRFQDFTFPEDLAVNLEHVADVVRSGQPRTLVKRYIRGDGTLVWVRADISAVRTPEGHTWLAVACLELPTPSDDESARIQYC